MYLEPGYLCKSDQPVSRHKSASTPEALEAPLNAFWESPGNISKPQRALTSNMWQLCPAQSPVSEFPLPRQPLPLAVGSLCCLTPSEKSHPELGPRLCSFPWESEPRKLRLLSGQVLIVTPASAMMAQCPHFCLWRGSGPHLYAACCTPGFSTAVACWVL